ncbi:hypothetical protein ACFFRR_007354 [Megaselia abdita]
MREIDPNASVDSVKRKLNIFKSNYKREQKRRKITGSKSKLWYFKDLSFLPEMDKNLSDALPKSDSSDFDISEFTGSTVKMENHDGMLFGDNSGHIPNYNPEMNPANGYPPVTQPNGYLPQPELRSAKSEPSEHDSFNEEDTIGFHQPLEPSVNLKERTQKIHRSEDDAEVFSRSWATLYRRIPESQQLLAKKLIDDILYEGCLGRLDEDKVQIRK